MLPLTEITHLGEGTGTSESPDFSFDHEEFEEKNLHKDSQCVVWNSGEISGLQIQTWGSPAYRQK